MSKIKVKGHDSGTGVITIEAPNTSTDRTLTLPDSTGELLSTAGGTMTGDLTIGTVGSVTSSGADLKITGTDDIFFNVAGATNNILQLYGGSSANDQSKFDSHVHPLTDNSKDLGSATERWKDLYLSGGLKVGGTGASNTLSDYEEGSHNQVWTTGNSGSITMNRVAVSYIKIGRLVTIFGEVDVSTVSSPVGGCRVSLPFTIASHSAGRNATTMTRPGIYHVIHHQDNPPLFMIPAGSSEIEGVYEQDGGAFADYNPAAGDAIYFGFSYLTT